MQTDPYERWRGKFTERRCSKCGEMLPLESFRVVYPKNKNPQLFFMCRECERTRERKRKRDVATGAVVQKSRSKPLPLPSERVPIPALEVGKAYRITDTGRTWMGAPGGDGNAKPVHFVGPCIGRYGANWALRTATGIRCFTPATLVGLQIKEVERIA